VRSAVQRLGYHSAVRQHRFRKRGAPVSDVVPTDPPVDVEGLEQPVAQPSRKVARPRRKTAKPSRKKAQPAAGKAADRKVSKRTARKVSKAASPAASSQQEVQVGSYTLALPATLAASLTAKDIKKLRAIFKSATKRGKKRAAKKS
jgi:hypothetical protein